MLLNHTISKKYQALYRSGGFFKKKVLKTSNLIIINDSIGKNVYNNIKYKQTKVSEIQYRRLFFKKKFSLFKNKIFLNKRLKQKVMFLKNFLKDDGSWIKFKPSHIRKKLKIFFYKKFNKLFFRDGRAILQDTFFIKKYMIQKYFTKKISTLIKKNWLHMAGCVDLSNALIICNLFYTFKDALEFIKIFGVYINSIKTHTVTRKLERNDVFAIALSTKIIKYIKKKKKINPKFKKN